MQRHGLAVITVVLSLVGAGCALPGVQPLVQCSTPGPSPYLTSYENSALNATMLAASGAPCVAKVDTSYCDEAMMDGSSGEAAEALAPPEGQPQAQTEEAEAPAAEAQPQTSTVTDASSAKPATGNIRY